MDRITTLAELVRQEVSSYATQGYNMAGQPMRLYFLENPQDHVFAILGPYDPVAQKPELVMMARIVGDQVIIEFDKSSKPLYSALRHAGLAEDQIVLAGQSE